MFYYNVYAFFSFYTVLLFNFCLFVFQPIFINEVVSNSFVNLSVFKWEMMTDDVDGYKGWNAVSFGNRRYGMSLVITYYGIDW